MVHDDHGRSTAIGIRCSAAQLVEQFRRHGRRQVVHVLDDRFPRSALPLAVPVIALVGFFSFVAALVSSIDPAATVVDLVNLDPEHDRTVIVQAGAFAEHALQAARYTASPDRSWIGGLYDYGHSEPTVIEQHLEVSGPWLTVRLPASTRIRLTLTLALRTRNPSYATPFDGDLPGSR